MTGKLARPAATPTADDAQLIEMGARRAALIKAADADQKKYRRVAATKPKEFVYGPGEKYLRPVDLPVELRARYEAWRESSGLAELEHDDPRLDEASDLEQAIYKTPAHTIAGILVKLRIVAENTRADPDERRPTVGTAYRRRGRDFNDWAAVSAWADAERLAGGEV